MVDGHEMVTTGLLEGILRKLVVPEHDWEQHYVDLDGGVFDVRVHLTDDERSYLTSLAGRRCSKSTT